MTKDLKRYDVILVDYGQDVLSGEQGGIRPSIIIQNDTGNRFSTTTIVMPLTSQIKSVNQPTHTIILSDIHKGLLKDSMVLGECMRQISEKRIIKYLGKIDNKEDIKEIKRVYLANFGD